jgi:CRP-like cAMP-binding protein
MRHNSKINCTDCVNTNCFIKKYCLTSSEQIERIHENKYINKYSKGQLIFIEGNFIDSISFVFSGRVKVFKNGAFGKDQIIRLISDGDILGHRGLSDTEKYSISASAISEAMICCFDKPFFYELLKSTPELTFHLMLFFANELSYEESKLRDLSIFNVREKVAKALLIITKSFGLNDKNEINFMSEISRQDIAELVGLNSNQVTKVLADFKDEGMVETKGKKITIINKKKLEEIINL